MNMNRQKLPIRLDHSCLEDQTGRLVNEIGLTPSVVQTIKKNVRELAELKIEEADKNWSEDTKKAFVNLTIAILIEEAKVLRKE